MKRVFPTWEYEDRYLSDNYTVIGIDEVGRGALAGPVCAGAFAVNPASYEAVAKAVSGVGVRDSKMLSPAKRAQIAEHLKRRNVVFALHYSSVTRINEVGIVQATYEAMAACVEQIMETIDSSRWVLLIDGRDIEPLTRREETIQTAIVKGDSKSMSIACASILAKVERDRYMETLAIKYPQFRWQVNKGYGTVYHRQQLREEGRTAEHRDLFIRNIFRAQ